MSEKRIRIGRPEPGDIIYAELLRETERNQLEADRLDAIREREEYEQAMARVRQCPVPIKPGNHFAAAAFKAGCEDEWIDRMKSRYGGEW